MENKFVVVRPINGIHINGDEYLKSDEEKFLFFDSPSQALEYINDNVDGTFESREELEKEGVYIKEVTFKNVWSQLGDVPIDQKENIEERFYHFPKGTDRFEIWHWLEETFDISIGDYLKSNSETMSNSMNIVELSDRIASRIMDRRYPDGWEEESDQEPGTFKIKAHLQEEYDKCYDGAYTVLEEIEDSEINILVHIYEGRFNAAYADSPEINLKIIDTNKEAEEVHLEIDKTPKELKSIEPKVEEIKNS